MDFVRGDGPNRRLLIVAVALILLIAGGTYIVRTLERNTAVPSMREPQQAVNVIPVQATPTPPPLPTATPQTTPTPPEVHKNDVVDIPSVPVAPVKPPDDKPDQMHPLGTITRGSGPSMGLGPDGDGLGIGQNSGSGANPWDVYAAQAQKAITEAIRNSGRIRGAVFQLEVRVWPDSTGRITRAKLHGSTGDPALDLAIQNDVLTGLQLQAAPPTGMPAPIILRLNASRP